MAKDDEGKGNGEGVKGSPLTSADVEELHEAWNDFENILYGLFDKLGLTQDEGVEKYGDLIEMCHELQEKLVEEFPSQDH
jgi:hypothetical protein